MHAFRTIILAAGCGLAALAAATTTRAGTCQNGWQVFDTPNPGHQSDNVAAAIAGLSPLDVWAVGTYGPDSSPTILRTLALHYDGRSWSVVATPNVGTQLNSLISLSVLGDGTVWAAGYYIDEKTFYGRPLLLYWDGTAWSIPAYADPGASGQFYGVAARAPNDVWAVGDVQAHIPHLATLIEHYDGTAWSVVPSPNPGNAGNVLYGVAAAAANDAWAVGSQTIKGGPDQALILHWDGKGWRNLPPQRDGLANTGLYSLAMTATGLVAVGDAQNDLAGRTLAYATAGKQFRNVLVGVSPVGDDRLQGVAAGPNGEWAVGATANWLGSGVPQTLVEYHALNASSWTIVPSPHPNPSDDNQLGGVAVIGSDAWIAGITPGLAGRATLIAKTCK